MGRTLSRALACMAAALAALPIHAATISVTSNGDTVAVDGGVTLREAIFSINLGANVNADVVAVGAYGTADTIRFAIGSGVQTIALTSALPGIGKPVVIDGTTQPGFAGAPIIVLDGVGLGGTPVGLNVFAGGPCMIRGLVVQRFAGGGIFVDSTSGGTTIAGNYVGIDVTGTVARANGASGITLSGAAGCTVGGTTAADRNVVSGNLGAGLSVVSGSANVVVRGNYIGTNAAGTAAVPNGAEGVAVTSTGATIGGTIGVTPSGACTGACNVISGNRSAGIGVNSSGAVIVGNRIGTAADGVSPLGNGTGGGASFDDGIYLAGAGGHRVGGTTAAEANVIANNNFEGVYVIAGTGNAILGNSIYGNGVSGGLGISLSGSTSPTANDACDADGGANNRQNFPILASAVLSAGNVTIAGTLNSTASTIFRVEFYSNIACNASGNGEGRTFLGFATVTTDGACNASFSGLSFAVPPGQTVITATATDPLNNTSEFSACLTASAGPTPTPTPTPTATATPTVIPTPTPTPLPTPSPTPAGGPGSSAVPALSNSSLAFFGLLLVGAALWLLRRAT
ncbi:MAG TPA: hypothetical protein VGM13_09900 [Thermoanaerobaculia bacterium]|jgi:hypothetical protein